MCGRWNSGCADVLSSPLAYRNLMKGVLGQLMINFGHQGNTSACGDSCTHAERPLCKAGAWEGPDFRESPSGNEETTRAPTLFAKTSCRTATTALSLAYALAWCAQLLVAAPIRGRPLQNTSRYRVAHCAATEPHASTEQWQSCHARMSTRPIQLGCASSTT